MKKSKKTEKKTTNLSIHWRWYGGRKHALVQYDGTEFVKAVPISYKAAELLIEDGMNSGS